MKLRIDTSLAIASDCDRVLNPTPQARFLLAKSWSIFDLRRMLYLFFRCCPSSSQLPSLASRFVAVLLPLQPYSALFQLLAMLDLRLLPHRHVVSETITP